MKTFKEVAHLYIGCKGTYKHHGEGPDFADSFSVDALERTQRGFGDFKPILRPLSDITENDAEKICWVLPISLAHENHIEHHFIQALINDTSYSINIKDKDFFGITAYLLSQSFDLFGLIERGEAIDSTTLTPNPYNQ